MGNSSSTSSWTLSNKEEWAHFLQKNERNNYILIYPSNVTKKDAMVVSDCFGVNMKCEMFDNNNHKKYTQTENTQYMFILPAGRGCPANLAAFESPYVDFFRDKTIDPTHIHAVYLKTIYPNLLLSHNHTKYAWWLYK